MDNDQSPETPESTPPSRVSKYAYMRRDGTLDIVIGSLVAGLGSYAFQFIAGRSLGEEQFAPIGVLLTAHFLAFLIVLVPIEQFVIRRLTLGARGWVLPARAVALAVTTAVAAAITVSVSGDEYFRFTDRSTLVLFALASVATHFAFAVGRGYLAGFRRFSAYGRASAAASLLRVAVAIVIALTVDSITGYAWAHVLGPLVIIAWTPWRGKMPAERDQPPSGEDDQWLLSGLVLSAAASQALLLASPLVASRLGASDTEYSIIYATLLVARAPLTIGYNLIARILPSFTAMAAEGERRELRAWARGIGVASILLAVVGGFLGLILGPFLIGITMGSGFAPSAGVAAMAGASVVLAGGGLFIGQILVAKSQPVRLASAWMLALVAAGVTLFFPMSDPVVHATVALVVGEVVALLGLTVAALIPDPDEVEISHGYVVAKRTMDIAGAIVLLFITLPIQAIAAIAVRIDSPGPAFFRQERVGRNGELFWMVKLRTMRFDQDDSVYREHLARLRQSADDADYTIKIDDDPRITKVGARLRAWSIDELPNLWNVLKGSMSLVGPRPVVLEEAEITGLDHVRFSVKPGLTGLAQVHGRDSIALAERTEWDERYVAEQSLRLDFRILFATVGTVFAEPGRDMQTVDDGPE